MFGGIAPGAYVTEGGLSFNKPGSIAHDDEPRHTHGVEEIFLILQGKAVVHFDGFDQTIGPGDVMVVDPGENHHMEADRTDPPVVVWLEVGSVRNREQTG
jgi:mannose-6-phosphate isomerase-like protein (cupin superfamily)